MFLFNILFLLTRVILLPIKRVRYVNVDFCPFLFINKGIFSLFSFFFIIIYYFIYYNF